MYQLINFLVWFYIGSIIPIILINTPLKDKRKLFIPFYNWYLIIKYLLEKDKT